MILLHTHTHTHSVVGQQVFLRSTWGAISVRLGVFGGLDRCAINGPVWNERFRRVAAVVTFNISSLAAPPRSRPSSSSVFSVPVQRGNSRFVRYVHNHSPTAADSTVVLLPRRVLPALNDVVPRLRCGSRRPRSYPYLDNTQETVPFSPFFYFDKFSLKLIFTIFFFFMSRTVVVFLFSPCTRL